MGDIVQSYLVNISAPLAYNGTSASNTASVTLPSWNAWAVDVELLGTVASDSSMTNFEYGVVISNLTSLIPANQAHATWSKYGSLKGRYWFGSSTAISGTTYTATIYQRPIGGGTLTSVLTAPGGQGINFLVKLTFYRAS